MNLALPALVILLGLLPGIACFYGYFSGRFDKRTAGVSGVEEVALYVIFAVPLNVIALWCFQRLGVAFDFSVATHLLAGTITDTAVHSEVSKYFQEHLLDGARDFLGVVAVSFVVGSVGRRLVWACRLDTRIPHLRLKHEWFYILQGRISGLPRQVASYVDVLTLLPSEEAQTRLYRGVVLDFEISSTGEITSLTLANAVRGRGRGDKFVWVEIPSSRLVLTGSNIHSINITYLTVNPTTSISRMQRVRQWLRSFMWQEP